MFKNNAKGRECFMKSMEMLEELGFGIEDMGILEVRLTYVNFIISWI